jgi:hypothetical protein
MIGGWRSTLGKAITFENKKISSFYCLLVKKKCIDKKTAAVNYHICGLASKQHSAGHRIHGLQGPSLLYVHKGEALSLSLSLGKSKGQQEYL